jgi:hypothetical protein
MTNVMGPILPHLAEEIHFTRQGGQDRESGLSVFTKPWTDMVRLDANWGLHLLIGLIRTPPGRIRQWRRR